jgi:hypothetical protein
MNLVNVSESKPELRASTSFRVAKMAALYPILALYSVVAAMFVFLISDPKIRAWIAGPPSNTASPESALKRVPEPAPPQENAS